ncbi:multidrug effflux MFS transporter [Psychrosphaera haliotis]|nr:multidrug effflux MFS transporter [Psychrosphaera haliotis]
MSGSFSPIVKNNSNLGKKGIVWLMMLFMILNLLPVDIYLPAVQLIATDLNTSVDNVQLGIFFYLISMGVGQLFLGALSDKYGRKPIALVSLFVYILASILATIATNLETLIASRLIQGIGACGCAVTALAVVRDLFDEDESAKIYSILNGAQSIVPALAPLLGGLISVQLGWRYCFALLVVLGAMTFIFTKFKMGETNQSVKPQSLDSGKSSTIGNTAEEANTNPPASRPTESNKSFWYILSHANFTPNAIASMASMAFIVQYVVKSPVLLIDNLGLTPTEFSLVFGSNAFLIMFAAFCATKLIGLFSARATCNIGLLLMGISSAMFFVVPNPGSLTQYLVFLSIGSFGFSFSLGSSIGMALAPFPECAGKASSVLGFLQFTVTSIVGIIVGYYFPSGAMSLAITVPAFALTSVLLGQYLHNTRVVKG